MTAIINERPLFRVGINVFVVSDGKLLMGKRKQGIGAGDWALPGGHLEYGEAMAFTAARELEEETGLKATSFTFFTIHNDVRADGHFIHVGFMANQVTGDPVNRETDKCEGWEWLDINNLPDNLFISHRTQIQLFKDKQTFCDS